MKIYLLALLAFFGVSANAQNQKMQWFADAKLGIFIHWGIYSVNGISESWGFYNNYISYSDYKKQLYGFSADKYDPASWVDLIKKSGAKYAVITSKHHDGVALWDTKAPEALSIPKDALAKKDVLTPFVNELKKADLKTGIYYSLPDWSHPWYNVFTSIRKRYDIKADPNKWQKFLSFQQQQLSELSMQYNPDLLWFDGDWEHTAQEWQADKITALLMQRNPNIIFNSRLQGHGDYGTPEQGIPVARPKEKYWELCYTMNGSWGYQPFDTFYKTPNMIIRTLVDCISMGGNLLLDIGPKADGTIPAEQTKILEALGKWTSKHQEAIYETIAGLPQGHFNGKTALSKSKKTLFLYLDYKTEHDLLLKGIKSKIKSVNVIGYDGNIAAEPINGTDYHLKLPLAAYDDDVTVIKIELNEPIELADPKVEPASINLLSKGDQLADKISAITKNISKGINPFKNGGLEKDGIGFNLSVKNINSAAYKWVLKNAEALALGEKGIDEMHFQGASSLSNDKKNLYLVVEGIPTGPIALKGLKNKINRIRIVGEGTILYPEIHNKLYWSKIPGIVYINLPKDRLDKDFTIINILLDSEIDLYGEEVGALTNNN